MHFNADYLTRLRKRDPETCAAFITSLTPVIEARLRYRFRDHHAIEDVRNETFCRVFRLLDDERVREPARLGAFVWGVCDRVALECHRKERVTEPLPEEESEPVDWQPSAELMVACQEMRALIWRELRGLCDADRQLLIEIHFEGRDRRQMARERKISPSGLNVRVCRALKRLRARMLDSDPKSTQP